MAAATAADVAELFANLRIEDDSGTHPTLPHDNRGSGWNAPVNESSRHSCRGIGDGESEGVRVCDFGPFMGEGRGGVTSVETVFGGRCRGIVIGFIDRAFHHQFSKYHYPPPSNSP